MDSLTKDEGGYKLDSPMYSVCTNKAEGTVPIYRGAYVGPGSTGQHMSTLDPAELTNNNFVVDYNSLPYGYVYPAPVEGMVPVYRRVLGLDHMTTRDPKEGDQYGYVNDFGGKPQFYAFP